MAHFHPLEWTIEINEFSAKQLDTDPVAQSVFVHEYVHYVQSLTGTIGRHILMELVRLLIMAGLHKKYGWPPPKNFEQIHLIELLRAASSADFKGQEPAKQFRGFAEQLEIALTDSATRVGSAKDRFVRLDLKTSAHRVKDFVHVVREHNGQALAIPITDRVVFENMARQIERNYLLFNNHLDTSRADRQRTTSHGDLTYVCLHDTLADILPDSETCSKWTITLCQVALLCRNPGTAFEHMIGRVTGTRNPELAAFMDGLRHDSFLRAEFNQPPLQELLNELTNKWGTAILARENWELHEFMKYISRAYNSMIDSWAFFTSPLLTWRDVGSWIASFGCPPLQMKDGPCSTIQGISTSAHWHEYFQLGWKLLK